MWNYQLLKANRMKGAPIRGSSGIIMVFGLTLGYLILKDEKLNIL